MIGPIRRGMVRRHANTDTRFSIDNQPLLLRAAMGRGVSNVQREAEDDVPELRRRLAELLALTEETLTDRIQFDQNNHLLFLALLFTAKQAEHARSVLTLGESPDATLITRSMLEGLSQLLWAAQEPDDRPLRWRAFAYVRDWRVMKARDAAGEIVPTDRREHIQEGLRQFGNLFLSRQAQKAKTTGRPLPDDPYVKNWYPATEKEIFSAVGGEVAYKELYGAASEWHHWRVGGLGPMLKVDEQRQTFTWTINNPGITAEALATAFMCLWQTLSTLEDVAQCGIKDKLKRLYTIHTRSTESVKN